MNKQTDIKQIYIEWLDTVNKNLSKSIDKAQANEDKCDAEPIFSIIQESTYYADLANAAPLIHGANDKFTEHIDKARKINEEVEELMNNYIDYCKCKK